MICPHCGAEDCELGYQCPKNANRSPTMKEIASMTPDHLAAEVERQWARPPEVHDAHHDHGRPLPGICFRCKLPRAEAVKVSCGQAKPWTAEERAAR